MSKALRIYFVVGEVSGDALGADLVTGFSKLDQKVEPLGLGGEKLQALGLKSLFDISDISMMGISAVALNLPKILKRVRMTADDILAKKPDILILIDSPEFAKQVAKRVKKKRPDLIVIKYVCPSVWAWRPGRATKMKNYIDHVLALLPFEPEVMQRLGGPETTYVGHPLAYLAGTIDLKKKRDVGEQPQILLMPGSRKSEVSRLLPILEKTAIELVERGQEAHFILPTVPHLKSMIEEITGKWSIKVQIIEDEQSKIETFKTADLAIAASGTALLELAMYGVPMISIYKPDPAMNAIRFLIKGWTAALPNLIADRVIVPERFNEFAHPGYLSRLAESLLRSGHERRAQIDGFKLVHERMKQDEPPAMIAARKIQTLMNA